VEVVFEWLIYLKHEYFLRNLTCYYSYKRKGFKSFQRSVNSPIMREVLYLKIKKKLI